MNLRHAAGNEKDRAGQGILTEEDEKELENLAVRDLELKKIAEKLCGNQRSCWSLEQRAAKGRSPHITCFPPLH